MSIGLNANNDGTGSVQIGGSDAIQLSTGLAATFVNNVSVAGTASITGATSVTGNLSFNSGYGSAAVAYGCRAWVNFNGSGTPAIRASGNVTSLTDNGTGDYTINFTTAMPDVNYGFACCSTNGAGGNSIPSSFSLATILTTSFRLIDARPTGAIDRDTFTAIFFR
jgi:hypothetical protein